MPLGGLPMIEHVLRRAQHFGFHPILCIPTGEYDEFNAAVTTIDLFEGHATDVQTRLMECAHHHKIRIFHALDGDDPFFDPFAVIESYQSAIAQRLYRILPSYHSQSGSGRMGTTYNLECPTGGERHLLDSADYPWPQRITVDYEEDYHLVCTIDRAVGGYMALRKEVDTLFVRNPQLHLLNWFRTQEWRERQLDEQRSGPAVREEICQQARS